jgi:hypothetical protein
MSRLRGGAGAWDEGPIRRCRVIPYGRRHTDASARRGPA